MPQSSTREGTPPSEVTASTMVRRRAGGRSPPASWHRTARRSRSRHARRRRCALRVGLERVFELVRVDRAAPRIVDHDGSAAVALDVLLHAPAEHAVAAHDHRVARLDQVDEAGLHARRARRGHRHGQCVVGLEGIAQQFLHLVHHVDEGRIEMTDGRLGHGRKHARMHVGGAGAHEGALGRVKRRNRHDWLSIILKVAIESATTVLDKYEVTDTRVGVGLWRSSLTGPGHDALALEA